MLTNIDGLEKKNAISLRTEAPGPNTTLHTHTIYGYVFCHYELMSGHGSRCFRFSAKICPDLLTTGIWLFSSKSPKLVRIGTQPRSELSGVLALCQTIPSYLGVPAFYGWLVIPKAPLSESFDHSACIRPAIPALQVLES